MAFKTLDDLTDINGKTALVRVDINVPMENGAVTDKTRIERIMPTIIELSDKGAKVAMLAHFGRPKGQVVAELSLEQIVPAVAETFGRDVQFVSTCCGEIAKTAIDAADAGTILLLENTRFKEGEEKNSAEQSQAYADLGDVYINDAFSTAHRAHASTEGVAKLLPSYAGRTMQQELEALDAALGTPKRPVTAIVGGAKVSTKLDLLSNLIEKVDALVIGGGMANTFLAAQGYDVGKSLCEHDLADTARAIIEKSKSTGCALVLPEDLVVAGEFAANAANETVDIDAIPADKMALDVGIKTIEKVSGWIERSETVVWNGPMGAFEIEPFDRGTVSAAQAAAKSTSDGNLISVAGGGDTVAALNQAGVSADFSYISTAGGAFLEWMEGKVLPGVAALEK